MTPLDRSLGAFLGFAVGDALGATVEFMTEREIVAKYGIHKKMIGGGWLKLSPGQVTDDTQMSLGLGRSLVRKKDFNLRDICEEWTRWLASGPIDVGNTCRRGINRYRLHGIMQGGFNEGDAGNGAAMRILPAVLATSGRAELMNQWILAQCHVTHNHPLSDAASLTLGEMVQALLQGGGRDQVRSLAEGLAERSKVFSFKSYDGLSSAYIVDTVRTVFDGYFSTDGFEECLIRTVNRGGDADTTGAIVGMLAGATWGVDAIPKAWLSKLDGSVQSEIRRMVPDLMALFP